jgi:hypothetical protein
MSKGLSWRQRGMLVSIAYHVRLWGNRNLQIPVAWRAINYGPSGEWRRDFDLTARIMWNIEQAQRRSLRSLEQRGLVKLGRYSFNQYADRGGIGPQIFWSYTHPKNHVPGETRIMTGAVLTPAGWAVVEQEERNDANASNK